jgi:hypothetical protein
MIKENLQEVQEVCRNKHLDLGEAILMINRNYGYGSWDAIPDAKKDELKTFFINNWFRCYQILEPEKHVQIMAMDTAEASVYQAFYNSNGERKGPIGRYPDKQQKEIVQHWSAAI